MRDMGTAQRSLVSDMGPAQRSLVRGTKKEEEVFSLGAAFPEGKD